MLGLRLTERPAAPPLPAFARGAALAIDARTGFGWRDGQPAMIQSLMSFGRTSAANATDAGGMVRAFPPGAARITDHGLHLFGTVTRLHDHAPAGGAKIGGSAASSTLPIEGSFTPRQFASGGASWHQWRIAIGAVTTGTPRFFRLRYRVGTSGRCFAGFTLHGAGGDSYVDLTGAVGQLAPSGSTEGTLREVTEQDFGAGTYEVSGYLDPAVDAATASFGVGPHSAVAGEDVTILAMQVTDQYADWITGPGSTVSEDGDRNLIDLTGLNLGSGFMMRLDGVLPTLRNAHDYPRLYQASPGTAGDRLQGYVITASAALQLEHHAGGSVQNGYPTLAQPIATGPFSLTVGHGPDFLAGGWNGQFISPITSPALYMPPTHMALGRDDLYASSYAAMIVERLAIYAAPPTQAVLERIAAL